MQSTGFVSGRNIRQFEHMILTFPSLLLCRQDHFSPLAFPPTIQRSADCVQIPASAGALSIFLTESICFRKPQGSGRECQDSVNLAHLTTALYT